MDTTKFIDKNPSLATYWRSIVLLGMNTASYKFSLAKTLLELPKKDNFIGLDGLAEPFAENIAQHIRKNDRQATATKSQFLDACRKFNNAEINKDELVKETRKHGFRYVFDAFHQVAKSEIPRFFEQTKAGEKGLILTDNFYELIEQKQTSNLISEVESRWCLWETAVSLEINPKLIDIKFDRNGEDLFILNSKRKRVDVTSSRDALSGYQKGRCFYCSKEISIERGLENSCDVDHFFPDVLKKDDIFNVDQVWNLVLACKGCNRGPGGKFERIPDISYLELLMKRNNYYVESHHPLRETILKQTGINNIQRYRFLQDFFNVAVDIIPSKMKWRPPEILGDQL